MTDTKPDMTVQFTPAAIYIKLGDGKVDSTTEVVDDRVMIDYDADGNVVGVEVLP